MRAKTPKCLTDSSLTKKELSDHVGQIVMKISYLGKLQKIIEKCPN